MHLFYTKSSPYANSVRMVITALGVGSEIEMIEAHPFQDHPQLLQANPLGKVPCLVDNGETILDSEVICDYLDANISGGQLFNPVYADWRLKTFYSVCSGLIDASVARRIEFLRDKEGLKSAFWWQRQSDAIGRTLDYLAARLSLLPEAMCVLPIQLMAALGYLDFRHSDINWREQSPALAAFFEANKTQGWYLDNPFSD